MTNVAVFGATSAIGEQVARIFAAEGARIFLVGRRPEQLTRIRDDLVVRGASEVVEHVMDLNDVEKHVLMLDFLLERFSPLDIGLVAYGTLGDQHRSQSNPVATRQELITNFVSPICLAGEVARRMEAQGHGTLGVICSVAGDRGRQSNYVYGAAKGGLAIFLYGLRHRLARSPVKIVICKPGFVDTPMTAGSAKGFLWAQPDRVARDIRRALERGSSTIYTPWFWRPVMSVIRHLPEPLFHRMKI